MILFDLIWQIMGYATARLLLPTLSFGGIEVQRIRSREYGFNLLGFRRRADGGILVNPTMASVLGLLIWVFMLPLAAAAAS